MDDEQASRTQPEKEKIKEVASGSLGLAGLVLTRSLLLPQLARNVLQHYRSINDNRNAVEQTNGVLSLLIDRFSERHVTDKDGDTESIVDDGPLERSKQLGLHQPNILCCPMDEREPPDYRLPATTDVNDAPQGLDAEP